MSWSLVVGPLLQFSPETGSVAHWQPYNYDQNNLHPGHAKIHAKNFRALDLAADIDIVLDPQYFWQQWENYWILKNE